ncbi:hypothetical protein M2263_002684 [Providencia alcalifaciens]|nr:hypothetical protein [Providencia alcalifaciens]
MTTPAKLKEGSASKGYTALSISQVISGMLSKFFSPLDYENKFLIVAAVKYTISSEQNLNKSHITV